MDLELNGKKVVVFQETPVSSLTIGVNVVILRGGG
tara:strand:+ start:412 stop:516 length:105 start_codon:yes stop_codon:yes gene_type:complete